MQKDIYACMFVGKETIMGHIQALARHSMKNQYLVYLQDTFWILKVQIK